MKIAEALQERADIKKKIAVLRERLRKNATRQEGESPAEDPGELLAELDEAIARLEELIAAINLSNSRTTVEGRTITEHIARKDCLRAKIAAYTDLASAASDISFRMSGREIKTLSAINVRELQKERDALAKELRAVDNLIQETNWKTELE